MPLRAMLAFLARAILSPAPVESPPDPVRALLLQRRTFDLVSAWMQMADLARLSRIKARADIDDHHRRVVEYNLGVTKAKWITTTRRAELLYRVLALPPRDLSKERLLIVGPRNVHELLMAWLHGFSWRRIDAIDLYSTNPKIREMDMEQMTFGDGTFDAVAMSNTLAYAADTRRALAEVARVLRPGGRFAFHATFDPAGKEWQGDLIPGQEIKSMLDDLGLKVSYYQAIDKVNSRGSMQTGHVLGVRKCDPLEEEFDRIDL